MTTPVVIILLPQFLSLPKNLLLLLWRKPLDLISVVVDEIQRFLIVADRRPWCMVRVAITPIAAVGSAVIDRTRVVPIGRAGIRGIAISIIDGWWIPIPVAISPSGYSWVAVIATTA